MDQSWADTNSDTPGHQSEINGISSAYSPNFVVGHFVTGTQFYYAIAFFN